MPTLKFEFWDEQRFSSSRLEWNALLEKSNADRLFLSWEWMNSWWVSFADSSSMELRIIAVRDENTKLLGIAPLYLTTLLTKKFIRSRQLQFIGNRWRNTLGIRTELLEFITDKSSETSITTSLVEYISSLPDWDELVLSNLNMSSSTYKVLSGRHHLKSCYFRLAETYKNYMLPLDDDFDSYIKSLGKNTRLRLFNRRKLLLETGSIQYETLDNNDTDACFAILNDLHRQRWGNNVYKGKYLEFNQKLASLMNEKGYLNFSVIKSNNTPVSIQYNYIINGHEYNIQAGFVENYHKKIALGYLHFGYKIEEAYQAGRNCYDFLAGEGKNSQYKEHLTGHSLDIAELQVIRNKLLCFIYRIYDLIKR